MALTSESRMQGNHHLHYHRTLGSCNPVEAFTTGGSSGTLAEWLQPYDGLSEGTLTDTSLRLGLKRRTRPQPRPKLARKRVSLPRADDTDSKPPPFTVFA